MFKIPLETAGLPLTDMIDKLQPGEEITLTKSEQPVATIRLLADTNSEPPRFGTLRGSILYLADDFDAIPEGFEEYIP